MFARDVGKPSKTKRVIYLIAATIMGILLSVIAHAFIEMGYLLWAESQKMAVPFYCGCALPPFLQSMLLALGIIGGFLIGRVWYRKIYVDRIWARK
jgi:hypothetical protein